MRRLRDYLARSPAVDVLLALLLAVAIVKLVDSLVVDIMMPLISHFFGNGRNMADYFIPLAPGAHGDMTYEQAREVGAVVGYGQFIVALVWFIIIATLAGLIVSGLRNGKNDGGAQ